jgi:methylenetetrahydrofolate reductase (NADH)
MRNKSRSLAALEGALRGARFEVLPTAGVEAAILEFVPSDVRLTVTASAAKGLEATLSLTERLVGHGYDVVPHLAARMISGRSELAAIVERLSRLGVTNVFCPAGDADPPAGEYVGALAMLEDLAGLGRPFPEVGITGYPESHPSIEDDVTVQSMWDKRLYATYVVSNLCFDPTVIEAWLQRIRRRGVELPVLIGLPGPVERTKLLTVATKIGVGQSVRFLRSHRSTFARIAAPGGFSPDRFLTRSAGFISRPELKVAGLHLYTFNQVAETESWRRALLASLNSAALPGDR